MQPPSHDETQPSLQFSHQPQYQQLQPQMMLCPVQFVYEPQIMVQPDPPLSEPAPPNQNPTFQNQSFLLNVQNTPPWIQNRPNMVYMPQMQMANMQPYIHQQMVPNPMYNYQYQPMIMHDQIRHIVPYMNQNVMQNPQMVQGVVQNPQNMAQNVIQNQSTIQNPQNVMSTQNVIQSPMRLQMEQKRESPMLSHILQNNMAKQVPAQHTEFASPMQIIRPHFQTHARPQMIIVNPIAPNHTCQTHNQKENPAATFEKPKAEVPMQIRKQIPDGLSVKTVFKLSATALVRPNEYVQNIAPVDEAHPRVYPKPVVKPVSNRDSQTNYKRKIREILEQNTKDEGEVQAFKRNCLVNKHEAANKPPAGKMVVEMPPTNAIEPQSINSGPVLSERLQQEQTATERLNDKLLRNTVYVQARGIVNEPPKTEMQNTSTSMATQHNIVKVKFGVPIEHQIETESSKPDLSVNISIVGDRGEHVGENSRQNDNVMPKPVHMNSSTAPNDLVITEVLPANDANIVHDNKLTVNQTVSPEAEPNSVVTKDSSNPTTLSNVPESDDAKLRQILKMARFIHTDDLNRTIAQNSSKMPEISYNNECDDTKVLKHPKINQFLHSDDADGTMTRNNSKMTKILLSSNADNKVKTQKEPKIKSKELRAAHKESKTKRARTQRELAPEVFMEDQADIYVLTHVLDGHIIQESNVPFIVQKPTLTRKSWSPIAKEDTSPSSSPSKKTDQSSTKIPVANELRSNSEAKELRSNSEAKELKNNSESKVLRTNSEAKELRNISNSKELRSNSEAKELRNKSDAKELKINSETKELRSNSEAKELRTNSEANKSRSNLDANLEAGDTDMSSDEETELTLNETEDDATNTENEEEGQLKIAESAGVIAQRNEEDPFEILSLSAVKLWTVSDLASYLMDHETWQDTAQKLLEEEIDGESLLLVNKDQLLQIGVSEEHVEVLSAFLARE